MTQHRCDLSLRGTRGGGSSASLLSLQSLTHGDGGALSVGRLVGMI